MTPRDPEAAMCAEQLRELLHWAEAESAELVPVGAGDVGGRPTVQQADHPVMHDGVMVERAAQAAADAFNSPPGQTAGMRAAMWRDVAYAVLDASGWDPIETGTQAGLGQANEEIRRLREAVKVGRRVEYSFLEKIRRLQGELGDARRVLAEPRIRRAHLDGVRWERERERDRALAALAVLADLVELKDGPRDDAYLTRKDAAWGHARATLGRHHGDPDV